MDYCIPCNRTLNGAVTCPECGAYDPDVAQSSDRRDGTPDVDAAMPEARFGGGPNSSGSPLPGSPTPSQDLPADDRPARLRKYAVRSLAAAAFTLLGGLATAWVLSQPTAPRAASIPAPPSLEDPGGRVTDSPAAPASPERVTTHPARKGVRDLDGGGIRRPLPTATRSKSPVSRPPVATTSTPPPGKAKPTPRTSSSRPTSPSRTATPSATPSASPSGGVSASPSVSGSPSGRGEAGD
ncbi:hypothetical protein BM536_000120 [Streptomyces phaeoluteigriseus]|uniref:Uncharacterized protein n=1 Tax=Streptomyces phaeoluteigriseus TaxID=114686 RepID=A0A1V6MZJ5_9ACTN|nr:hypothetical protein BM536_000120 [Streptomyces phaeoluteigriseus]